MPQIHKRNKTSCDVCRFRLQCANEGIVYTERRTGEWTGLHFWIYPTKDCPIDVRVRQR